MRKLLLLAINNRQKAKANMNSMGVIKVNKKKMKERKKTKTMGKMIAHVVANAVSVQPDQLIIAAAR